MTSPTIETDLGKILERIEQSIGDFRQETNQQFSKVNERLNQLEIGQARLEEKLTAVEKDIVELKGTTKNQLWSLIVLLAGTLLTIGAKVFIFPGKL
jgi:predicted nuclease with TOPRIM domain